MRMRDIIRETREWHCDTRLLILLVDLKKLK